MADEIGGAYRVQAATCALQCPSQKKGLGIWSSTQRHQYWLFIQGKLSRITALEKIEFEWNTLLGKVF